MKIFTSRTSLIKREGFVGDFLNALCYRPVYRKPFNAWPAPKPNAWVCRQLKVNNFYPGQVILDKRMPRGEMCFISHHPLFPVGKNNNDNKV